uniref:RING-type domain-containing protein n=1 Tax=Panagrolaimus davidi TaxID=227884 RepID=A0A914NY34_9BILA
MKVPGYCQICSKKLTLNNSFPLSCGHFIHSSCASPTNPTATKCQTCHPSSPTSPSHSSGYFSPSESTFDYHSEVSHDLSEFLSFKDYQISVKKEAAQFIASPTKTFLAQAEDKVYLALSCVLQKRFTAAYRELCQMRILLAAFRSTPLMPNAVPKTQQEKESFKKFVEWNLALTKNVESEIQKYFLF